MKIGYKILSAVLCASTIFGITGCGKNNTKTPSVSKICMSKKYPGNGYIVKLADDGDTIKKMSITFKIDEDYLKQFIKEGGAYEGYTMDEVFNLFEENMYSEYQSLAGGQNGNLSYFSAKYQEYEEQHKLTIIYNFDTTSKVLKKGVKDPSTSFYEWISYFELDDVYDSEKDTFSYKKLKTSHRFQNMAKMRCRTVNSNKSKKK